MKKQVKVLASAISVVLVILMLGCGGGSKPPVVQSVGQVLTASTVALSVSPNSGDLQPGESLQFTTTVTGSANQNVTWIVKEGAAGGSITAGGLYTASAATGIFHVVATSSADATKTVTVPIMVENLAVLISPRGIGLLPGTTRSFAASVAGCMDDRVSWAVQEGAAGGIVTSEGLYTAPMQIGEYHVTATSLAHPGVSASAAVIVTNSGFLDAGAMTQSRSWHTATLLQNGDVLLAGGESVGQDGWADPVDPAELFDHTTGRFRPTGSIGDWREGHTATLLPNGRVLVAGGGCPGFCDPLDSAKLYDPATGQFTATGNMVIAREDHTATLLVNGKVLLAGGYTPTAELYDPATGTFTRTGSMSVQRSGHTATLLADGRVLVANGADSAEIYDPATGTFVAVAPEALVDSREGHTATLLVDGRVLLAGGQSSSSSGTLTYRNDALIFNPASGAFSLLPDTMNDYRCSHTATLLPNGQVLLVGGRGKNGQANSTAELFIPTTSAFLATGSLAQPRAGHTATLLLDGRVLVAGGANDKSAELYVQRP